MPALRWFMGFVTRSAGTVLVITFALVAAVEISIPGGYRAVVFPNGLPPVGARSARAQAAIDEFHLDDSWVVRWLKWLGDAVRGDFGISGDRGGTGVVELIVPRLSISLQLTLVAVALTLLIGVPMGVFAAARHGRISGKIIDLLSGIFQSVPVFITPIFFVWLFAIELQWLPAAGWVRISDSFTGNIKGLILPVSALALTEIGFVARVIRADVTEVLQTEYVAAAASKGLSTRYVLFRHALRPASLGLLNVLGMNIGALLSGTFVIELIFGIGAMGRLYLEALLNRDLNLLLGVTTYVVLVYVIVNGVVDALMHVADPRIRRQ